MSTELTAEDLKRLGELRANARDDETWAPLAEPAPPLSAELRTRLIADAVAAEHDTLRERVARLEAERDELAKGGACFVNLWTQLKPHVGDQFPGMQSNEDFIRRAFARSFPGIDMDQWIQCNLDAAHNSGKAVPNGE